jgi:hypothetical protein
MNESTMILLSVIGALLSVLTTVLILLINGMRKDLKEALNLLAEHQDEITTIKTVLKLNGCADVDKLCGRRKDDR